jgi:hypothetical protein
MLQNVDGLLRSSGRFAITAPRVPWLPLLALLAAGGFLYGMAMGLFGVRALQAFYSGLKVPLLLVVTSAVCLPNFFVVNTLLGLRDDFASALRGVVAAQATMAVVLAALGPLTLWVYASTSNYRFAILLNGLFFLVAALVGQVTLARHYEPLLRRNPRHRYGKAAWLTLYVFVAIQLAWTLRPFVGDPSLPVTFFREDAWSNAYVAVFRHLVGVVT